jgi:sphingosine kinase
MAYARRHENGTNNSGLTASLLAGDNGMETFEWPQEEASRAKLYIPPDYEASDDHSEEAKCFIRYDPEHKVLLVVAEESQDIIDAIDPRDIVGAAVEVELFSGAEELRSTKPAFQNHFAGSSPVDADESKPDSGDDKLESPLGIFQPLRENMEIISCGWDNAPLSDIPFDTQAAAVFTIYAYPHHDRSRSSFNSSSSILCGVWSAKRRTPTLPTNKDPSKLGHREAAHRRFEVAPAEDFSYLTHLVRAIRKLSNIPEQRRLLVVVNPKSGTQEGLSICDTIVVPVLEQAGIEHDIFNTTHERHAEERMKHGQEDKIIDISQYDGVIAIGGDGIVHEILQGLSCRSDFKEICCKLKLGVIGAGTGNGLAKSLAHSSEQVCAPLDSIFLAVKGNSSWMDLARYTTQSAEHLSFLTFSWSIIADIDMESECISYIGSLRFDLWAVWRVIALRKYRARFSYLPATIQNIKAAITDMPALNDPVPQNWVSSEDDFYLFWASQVTHAAENVHHAPPCKLHDGVFHIVIVRKHVSRYRMAMILLALETGAHVSLDGLEIVECVAYRLEPITPGSFNDLDGEVIESGPIQGQVLPAAIQAYHL